MERGPTLVLVVEDDAALRLVCRVNLELGGFAVSEAATLDEARSAVAAKSPAVVLLDLHLGGSAADELLDELRAAGTAVVLVSGTADARAYEGRASAVLSKPFEPAELVETTRRLAAAS